MMKQKKRLLILIWNMGLGGIQKRMRDVVLDINKNYLNWNVYFLIKQKDESHFLTTIQKQSKVKLYFFSDVSKTPRNVFFLFWVTHQYLKIKPNVCLTFLDHLSISLIAINKIVFWIKSKIVLNEGVLTSKYLPLNNRASYWSKLIRIFYPKADQIIVPTQEVSNDLINNFLVPKTKIKVIPNWTLFRSSIKKNKKKKYDLIFIGRFEKEKNPLGFVKIVHSISKVFPKVTAVMLGTGAQLETIISLITKYKLHNNITLLGSVSNPDTYLNESRILVLPTQNEGMPNVVLEAAMKKIPTISSNFPGVEEIIINNKTGLIGTSINQMSALTINLLKNPHKIRKIGTNAAQHVKNKFHRSRQTEFINTLLN